MTLRDLFDTPSSFEGQPAQFARNAIGHALIVGALPAFLLPGWLPLFLVGYVTWEAAQWRWRQAEAWDCLHDFAYVLSGALAVFEPVILGPLLMFLVADVLRRA
jgi:hypothetical protein